MGNFAEFWDSLGVFSYLLVAVLVLFCIHLIFVIYRSVVFLAKREPAPQKTPEGVSVIITSNNKADYLKENLEAFLTQDYPEFEVIVVDECSEDSTQDVLAEFQKKYSNLRITRIFPDTKFHCTKKLAINIGVLAASYDILLFSEINCTPQSKNWIGTMQSRFDQNTAVVIGFTNYAFHNEKISFRRFFRFSRFLKMVMMVRSKAFVLGDGCNMAYRKKYYIEKRGFSKNSQIYMGYDYDMVKSLSEKGKVKVIQDADAFIQINDIRKKTWTEDFSYYYATKREWAPWTICLSDFDAVVKFLFYILAICLIFSGILHKYIFIFVLLAFLMDIVTINVYLRHLYQKKLFLTSLTVSTVGFLYRWYYNVYSIFTSKKWR